jgi:hypothetical protein
LIYKHVAKISKEICALRARNGTQELGVLNYGLADNYSVAHRGNVARKPESELNPKLR